MRVSLVKCRSCRTGCSCTAETGICTVPGGVVRYTWGTAPTGGHTIGEKKQKSIRPISKAPSSPRSSRLHLDPGPAWSGCPARRRWALPARRRSVPAWRRTSPCGGWGTSCDPPPTSALRRWRWLLGDSPSLRGEEEDVERDGVEGWGGLNVIQKRQILLHWPAEGSVSPVFDEYIYCRLLMNFYILCNFFYINMNQTYMHTGCGSYVFVTVL